jgi:hypothetical protein
VRHDFTLARGQGLEMLPELRDDANVLSPGAITRGQSLPDGRSSSITKTTACSSPMRPHGAILPHYKRSGDGPLELAAQV